MLNHFVQFTPTVGPIDGTGFDVVLANPKRQTFAPFLSDRLNMVGF